MYIRSGIEFAFLFVSVVDNEAVDVKVYFALTTDKLCKRSAHFCGKHRTEKTMNTLSFSIQINNVCFTFCIKLVTATESLLCGAL